MAKRSSTWDSALALFRPFIIAQGEVGYAHNLLQESFFNLFVLVMTLERPAIPLAQQAKFYPYTLAIWNLFQNDRQQRKLVLTALANLPTTLNIKGAIARLQWAQEQADELANYRNIIVHAPMKFWYDPRDDKARLIPSLGGASTKPIHIRRLRLIKNTRFWKSLRNDLLNLNDYVDFVTRQIAWREYERQNGAPVPGAQRSWPRKPKLPCAGRIKKIDQAVKAPSNPPASPKRRRRPRPSGGRQQGKS
jgi:hypothetical protein